MTYEWTLPDDATAARAARQHVSTELDRHGVDATIVDDCVLIASELAANAVRHGEPPVVLRLGLGRDRIRIEVHDRGDARDPYVLPPSASAPNGRGLAMVRQLAVDHGWRRDSNGVIVWAEVALTGRPSP